MDDFRSCADQTREPSLRGRFSLFSGSRESGNVLLYVLLAIGLMAALTYAYVKDSRENYASQSAVQIAETLYSQANMIRSAVVQCALEYPQGGGDMFPVATHNDGIDYNDNPNNPYPLNPSSLNIPNAPAGCTTTAVPGCIASAADDKVKNLTCIGAPIGSTNMFQGANNQGRFLPPPPAGFSEWTYTNDTSGAPAANGKGVYIQIQLNAASTNDAASINAINRVMDKFQTYQADLNYGGCGARCLTIWIQRNCTTTCP